MQAAYCMPGGSSVEHADAGSRVLQTLNRLLTFVNACDSAAALGQAWGCQPQHKMVGADSQAAGAVGQLGCCASSLGGGWGRLGKVDAHVVDSVGSCMQPAAGAAHEEWHTTTCEHVTGNVSISLTQRAAEQTRRQRIFATYNSPWIPFQTSHKT